MEGSAGAVRYALRQFRQTPMFTAAAVLTLALGIGGTTAIFTLINAVMLQSLPFANPNDLYRIGDSTNCCVQGGPQQRWGMYSYALYERLKAETPEFEELAAFQAGVGRLSVRRQGVDAAARSIRTEYVTGNYFKTLGVGAFGGRVLTADDDTPSSAPVIVLSHHLWQTTYGRDPSVVGSTFIIEGHPFTAVGIAPPGFFGDTLRNNPPDVWIPVHQEAVLTNGNGLLNAQMSAWLRAVGRVRPGASVDGLGPRLTALLRQWIRNDSGYPASWMPDIDRTLSQQVIAIVPAGAGVGVMREQYRESLQILLAVCGLVLLVACANVANLLLARAVARRGQTAVRLAVGAGRRNLITQALVESVVLSLAGAVAGLVVAKLACRLLLALAFSSSTFLPIDTNPSPLVLAFAFSLALATGLLFGTAPAWFATRTNPIDALRGAGRTMGDHGSRTRTGLLIVQATLAIVLVAGATLLARGLNRVEHQQFGYETRDRVLVTMNWLPSSYTDERRQAVYRAVEERLGQLPGIKGVGLALYNPLTDNWGELVMVAGHPPPALNQQSGASWNRVSARYLQNLGMTVVRGRMISEQDTETTSPVAVVNETFVKRFFRADEDPIGQHFGLDEPENVNTFEIVGIVRDSKFTVQTLRQDQRSMFFVPLTQHIKYRSEMMQRLERISHGVGGLMLVTPTATGALEPVITKALAEVDSNLTVNGIRTLEDQIALAFDQDRAVASLAGLFGVVSLILAAIGLYGVMSYSVSRRTNEIGVRVALGADRGRILNLVLKSALWRVVAGVVIGIPLAIGAGRLLASRLYGVSFWDPLALSTAAAALLASAIVAALIPATRAAAISPMRALRTE